jgi:LPS-assembly lipoprotein
MQAAREFGRRWVLPCCTLPLLAACGFKPMYAASGTGQDGPATTGLAQISVGLIPERTGQLLRNALQERFERAGVTAARRYDLAVVFQFSADAISVQQDSSITRERFIGLANYRLISQDPSRATLTTGVARAVDGLNVFDQQFFAVDQETETVQRRVAEAVADQIALQLAAFFNKRAAGGAG